MTKRITTLLAVLGLAVAAPVAAQARQGADDDPATHDSATTTVVDDRGGDRPAGVRDDPATHDVNDDKAAPAKKTAKAKKADHKQDRRRGRRHAED